MWPITYPKRLSACCTVGKFFLYLVSIKFLVPGQMLRKFLGCMVLLCAVFFTFHDIVLPRWNDGEAKSCLRALPKPRSSCRGSWLALTCLAKCLAMQWLMLWRNELKDVIRVAYFWGMIQVFFVQCLSVSFIVSRIEWRHKRPCVRS